MFSLSLLFDFFHISIFNYIVYINLYNYVSFIIIYQSVFLKPHLFDGYRHNNNCNFGGVKLITNPIPGVPYPVNTDHGPFCYKPECPLFNRHFHNPENGSSMVFYAFSNYFTFNVTMIVQREACVGIVNVCAMCGTDYLQSMNLNRYAENQIYQKYTSKSFTILCDYFNNLTDYGEIHIVPILKKCFVLQSFPRTEVRKCFFKVPGRFEEYQGKYHIELKFDAPKLKVHKSSCFIQRNDKLFNTTTPHYKSEKHQHPIAVHNTTDVLKFTVSRMTIYIMTYCLHFGFIYTMRVWFPNGETNVCPVYEPKMLPYKITNDRALCYKLVCERDGIASVMTLALHRIVHRVQKDGHAPTAHRTAGYTMSYKANNLLRLRCSSSDNKLSLIQLHIFALRRRSDVIVHHLILLSNISYITYTLDYAVSVILLDKPIKSCTVEVYFEIAIDALSIDATTLQSKVSAIF